MGNYALLVAHFKNRGPAGGPAPYFSNKGCYSQPRNEKRILALLEGDEWKNEKKEKRGKMITVKIPRSGDLNLTLPSGAVVKVTTTVNGGICKASAELRMEWPGMPRDHAGRINKMAGIFKAETVGICKFPPEKLKTMSEVIDVVAAKISDYCRVLIDQNLAEEDFRIFTAVMTDSLGLSNAILDLYSKLLQALIDS